jgi:hypothetical protein
MPSFQDMKVNEVTADEYACDMSSFRHSLYITHEWVSSVGSDRQVVYLHFEQNGEVVAKLSGLVLVGSKLVGKYLFFYAAPGLRYHTPELFNKAMVALKRYAKRNGFAKIDMLNYDQQHDWVCTVKGYIRRGREEFIRFFEGPEAKLQFSKSLMYNVRKAQKANATFHHENSERILEKLHDLLAETQKLRFYKYGTEYSPYPYFLQTKESTDALFRSGLMKLYHIEIDGEIHCVRCALEKDKRMFGMMIASDSVAYKHGLQHFMQYCLIEEMHRNGYLYYNVSGTAPGEEGKGLTEYKESLGCMRAFVYGAYTHFLPFPQNMLNPVMDFGRFVAKHPILEKPIAGVSKILFKHQSV